MILSVDDIKAIVALNIAHDDHQYDDYITQVILDVQGGIERYIGQPIEQETRVYQFVGTGAYTHTLPYSLCTAATTLQTRSNPAQAWAAATGTFALRRTALPAQLWYEPGFGFDEDYRATITVGWASEAIPQEILSVAREMCVLRYQEMGGGGADDRKLGVASLAKAIQGGSATIAFADLTAKWQQRLSKYRIPTV